MDPGAELEKLVFISYSKNDRKTVHLVTQLLRAGGARVFLDINDIEYGDRWEEILSSRLSQCERVLVFWSAKASRSVWVREEWRLALALRKRIVPICLDSTPLPPELAQFHKLDKLYLKQLGIFSLRGDLLTGLILNSALSVILMLGGVISIYEFTIPSPTLVPYAMPSIEPMPILIVANIPNHIPILNLLMPIYPTINQIIYISIGIFIICSLFVYPLFLEVREDMQEHRADLGDKLLRRLFFIPYYDNYRHS